jgi:hypothetical protein
MTKNEDDLLHSVPNDSIIPLLFSQVTAQYSTYLPQSLLKIPNLDISEFLVTKL